jgi:hypothetical protein
MTVPIIYPRVCIDENLLATTAGKLQLRAQSVPQCVVDQVATSTGDGSLVMTPNLPGKLLINMQKQWTNNTTLDQMVLIRITRGPRTIITSNPNAIQFRDRWTWAIDGPPAEPVTSDILNGQVGCAVDLGTNSVAEPNPGQMWMWTDVHSADEWVGPVPARSYLKVWYRCYVWTPPPWSDNANKNAPQHSASAKYARMQLWRFPQQGNLVAG